MDIHSALTALMRPVPTQLGFPFNDQALLSVLASKLDTPLGILPYDIGSPNTAFTPTKKAKLDMELGSPVSSHSSGNSTNFSSPQPSPCRKPAIPIPDEKKDSAYFERRRKNNDAAKRSRDARRHKEEAVAAKASLLEQENIQLRGQIAVLQQETAKLQLLLFSQTCKKAAEVKQEEENDD